MESTTDKSVFWTSVYTNAVGWAILFFFKLITLSVSNAIIAFTMLIFAGINLYGFFRCSKDQQKKINKYGNKLAAEAAKKGMQEMVNRIK